MTKWLASSHHQIESYRLRVFPVTSTRNGEAIRANPAHGGVLETPRKRLITIHAPTGSSIITGYSASRAPNALPANCGRSGATVASTSCPTVATTIAP